MGQGRRSDWNEAALEAIRGRSRLPGQSDSLAGRGTGIDAFAPRLTLNRGTPPVNCFERASPVRAAHRRWSRIIRVLVPRTYGCGLRFYDEPGARLSRGGLQAWSVRAGSKLDRTEEASTAFSLFAIRG